MTYDVIEKIIDGKGFVYEVKFEHAPQHGHSIAYYKFQPIADVSYGKMSAPPDTDDDGEWEAWQERFDEWVGPHLEDLVRMCKEYFNNPANQ